MALRLPGHARHPTYGPPHHDDLVVGLPYALDVHPDGLEEDLAVEAQRPEDELVVVEPVESVDAVPEYNVLPGEGQKEQLAWCRVK